MNLTNKFQNKLQCICNNYVIFEIIDNVECDWGFHTIIQCPVCEELFSTDKKCPAFQNIMNLLKNNSDLFSKKEQLDYLSKFHSC